MITRHAQHDCVPGRQSASTPTANSVVDAVHLVQDEAGRNEEVREDEAEISRAQRTGVRAEAEKSEGDEGCDGGSGAGIVDKEMQMSAVEEER